MIEIKDTSNLTRFSTPINEGAKRKYTLMKEDYVSFKFSVPDPIYFKLGDYVDGTFGLFELVDLQKPTYNESTGGYDYELRLDAYYWKWKNKKIFYSPQTGGSEASWNLTASLKAHMDVFLNNLTTLGYTYKGAAFSVIIDSTVVDSAKLVQYDNISLIDALSQMAQAWECEWWIIGSTINFGRCQNSGDPVNFELEENVSSMTRSNSKTSYATRIYAFGSTRNIPNSYRKDLIFDVKSVKGRKISDTTRKLEIIFFPESAKIEAPKISNSFQHSTGQEYYTQHPIVYSRVWPLSASMQSGKYRIIPESVNVSGIKGGAGHSISSYKASLSLLYTAGGKEKSVLIESLEGISDNTTSYIARFTEKTFILEEDATNCRLSIYSSVEFFGNDINFSSGVICNAKIQPLANAANIQVTFASGVNKGRTLNAVYNPGFQIGDQANVIELPEGVAVSIGDTYTIDNIIKSRVPATHFSKSSTELTVEGVVTTRLMLPEGTNCVNAYENMTQEEAIEDIVIFEDVYPRRVGTMVEVKPYPYEETIKEDGKDPVVKRWDAYRFKDTGFTFSEDYVLPRQDLKIKFESGALNGMTFLVWFNPFDEKKGEKRQPEKNADGTWNEKAQVFEIKRDEDSVLKLPGGAMIPKDGDKYVLEGFDPEFVLDTMIPNAEKELNEKAQEYVEKSKIDPSVYGCKMKPAYIHNNGVLRTFNLGDRVNLINKTYFDTGRESRIIGYEYPLDIPYDKPIYTVGETVAYSRLGALEEKVESLTYKGQTYNGSGGSSSGGNSVYVIGKNDKTTPTDRNVFSSLRVLEELLNNNEELKNLFLSKTGPDRTNFLLELLGGLNVQGGAVIDSLDSDYIRVLETLSAKLVDAVRVDATNITATEKVSGATIEATGDVRGKNVLASEGVGAKNIVASEAVTGKNVTAQETVSGKNAAISGKTTTLNLLVQQLAEMYDLNVSHVATLFRTIVKDYISSETFIPGFTGEGMKLYKALNGDWNLEIDNLVVRKVMTVFELVISKIRAINGGLVISPANGTVKSVSSTTGTPSYYVLTIEGDMMFVANDLVRCQVFTGTCIKYYWVPVASVNKDTILILKSDFPAGVVPAEGDDLVQMGNTTNTARQGLLYLTAAEDGKPRISVLDGVNSTSLVGKNKVILGCLDGMTDTDFPTDAQPSGYGLYAMNVFLKGIFILRNGKTIESELTTTNAAAKAAKDIADAAKSLATSANSLLADIASDNKLTPLEKQATKKEWDQIVSEKPLNNASAAKFGVATTTYDTAYNALNTYITPLLASLSVTSDIVGATFRNTFKAYYDARTNLLNAVSVAAKTLADNAQKKANDAATAAGTAQTKANEAATAAGSAQTTANNALTGANGANALLSDIANDNKLTPSEKQSTKKEWDAIVSEKPLNDASAVKFGVATTAYTAAYTALNTYITPLLTSLTTTQDIVGTDFRAKFKVYYDARTNLLNAVSAAAKALADAAQIKANAAQKAADDLNTQLTTIETKFEIREGQISSKVTEVTTKATQAATSATNAKASETNASGSATTAGQKATAASGSASAAAGSATTAGTKAGEAATSATNAKKSADDAAAKLVTITTKETSINQTAESINLKASEVTTKTTQAGNSANAAAGSASAAAGSATTAGQKATSAAGSAADAAAKLVTITSKETAINQTAGQIELKATRAETAASKAEKAEASINVKADGIVLQASNEAAKKAVDGVQVGVRNLIRNSDTSATNSNYCIASYSYSMDLEVGETYTLVYNGCVASAGSLAAYMESGYFSIDSTSSKTPITRTVQFVYKRYTDGVKRNGLHFYHTPQGSAGTATINWAILVKGNKAPTQWSPAPEDIAASTEAARLAAVAAQTTANSVKLVADAAKLRLDNWSADGSISPTEKLPLKQEQKALTDEKTQIVADASKYAVSSTAYVTAYTNYNGELTYHTTAAPEIIPIRANFATYQTAYYAAKQTILNAIAAAAKQYADEKATAAKNAAIADSAGKYTTKTAYDAQVKILNDSIALKVAKTDFDALGRRVGTAETTISQHSSQISLKASQTDVTALGTRMSSAEAKITPDAIKLTVKSQTDAIAQEKAKAAIDGLQIGGRNYIILSKIGSYTAYNTTPTYSGNIITTKRVSTTINTVTICVTGFTMPAKVFTLSGRFKKNGSPVTNAMWQSKKASTYSGATSFFKVDDATGDFVITELYASSGWILHTQVQSAVNDVFTLENLKFEEGNKATDWSAAPEDVAAGTEAARLAAVAAQTTANTAKTAAGAAQTTANTAVTNANTANTLLADIASDSKLTASEKQATKKEWDAIVSEKIKNDASADKFAVSKTAYTTAYTSLNTYITPLLASLTATSTIVGVDFRVKFKAYYDARTDLLNAISAKAKTLADDAQVKANAAQSNLDSMQVGGGNLMPNGDFVKYSTNNSIGWNNTLNGTYVIGDWGTGYNAGVAAPTTGYHAHLNIAKFGFPVLEFVNKNSAYGQAKRWMGIGVNVYLKEKLLPGQKYTFSADLMVDTVGAYIHGGLYSYKKGATSNAFSSGQYTLTPTAVNVWQRVSYTFTVDPAIDLTKSVTFYIYGYSGTEGVSWVKNVSLQLGTKGSWTRCDKDVDVRITEMETSFEIREGQISSKVTQATTSATTATTKATEAAASAGTASTKATEAGTKATQAAGSASTAGAKAGEAATSASNAKKAADDAAAKLVTITQKETAINQTASSINLKATEVTTKATEAANSATTAGQKATAAAGSAATAGTKAGEAASSAGTAGTKANAAAGSATAAANSASSAAASLSSVTTKQSEINVKADQITLQVSTVTTKTAEAINAAELASAMSKGKMLYRDPTFKIGSNKVNVYNNLSNGVVTVSRIAAIAGCPNSGYCLKINTTAAASPGWGGFHFGTTTRANATFVVRIIANIPVGRTLTWTTNATGTGGSSRWLTPTAGTGKWEEYAYKITCGSSGTFSSTAFFYLVGGPTPTATAPLAWHLAYATVFDTTDVDDVPTVDEIKAGIGVTAGKISIFGKDISLAGAVTFTSLDSTTQGKITTAQTTADTAKTAAVTAQTTANSAVTNANTANTLLADIASDSKLTASEKQQTKKEWDAIVSEKVKNDASASKFGVSTAACTTAYNALNTYITPLLASLTTTSAIVGTTFRANFKAYYDARTDLLNAISAKAKDLADAAQVKANKAETDASNALINSRNNIAAKLGYASYADMEAKAAAGQTIITGGKIRTNLIEAEAIVTNALVAKAINAATITTGKLNVTDGAKIGGWSVTGNDLTCNGAGTAKLKIEVNGNKFLRINDIGDALLSIRHDSGDCIRLQTYSVGAVGMSITANSGGAYAIKSAGAHQFMQRANEKWNAPGVLWCGRYNSWNANSAPYLITSWGDGLNKTPSISRYGYGKFSITHSLGHSQYCIMAMALNQRADGGQYWASIANYGGIGDNSFNIEFKNDGGSEQCPGEFQVIIFGRNRW